MASSSPVLCDERRSAVFFQPGAYVIARAAAGVGDDVVDCSRADGLRQLEIVAKNVESPGAGELRKFGRIPVQHIRSRRSVDEIAAQLVAGHGIPWVEESCAD